MSLPAGECVQARAGVGINWRGRGTKFQLCAALGLKQKRAGAVSSQTRFQLRLRLSRNL